MSLHAELVKFCATTLPDLPSEAWWLAPLVLLILGAAAVHDAFTGRVPDPLTLGGTMLVVGARGLWTSWPLAARHLVEGFAIMMALWALNHLYYLLRKEDGLGMGDGKWTLLAVTAFGIKPSLFAWTFGAFLGLAWLGVRHALRGHSPEPIHFAPFLFAGLLAAFCLPFAVPYVPGIEVVAGMLR